MKGLTARAVDVVRSMPEAPPDAAAVLVTLTVVGPGAAGNLTAYPHGAARPTASNLNFIAGQTVANTAVVAIRQGQIDVYNASVKPTGLVVDVSGFYRAGAVTEPGAVNVITPTRVLGTRRTTPVAPLRPGESRELDIAGNRTVPAGATGVLLDVTATVPGAAGSLALDTGNRNDQAPVLSFAKGQTIAAFALVRPDADGIVHNLERQRRRRSRGRRRPGVRGRGCAGDARIHHGRRHATDDRRNFDVPAHGSSGFVPPAWFPAGAATAVAVTVDWPAGTGYLTVWGGGPARPLASTLNFVAGGRPR